MLGREEDGRWWADIESMPGVMAYGVSREAAIAAVRALAVRVAVDCNDRGEDVLAPLAIFSPGSRCGAAGRRSWEKKGGKA